VTIEILGMGWATCTQRIIATALENNADFELVLVDLRKGEQKSSAHLARQPFGKIPACEETTPAAASWFRPTPASAL
jgi:glutathione S-transferase